MAGEDLVKQSIMIACVEQAKWMKNYTYNWPKWNPKTVEKSKEYGTCVTYVACVLQRLGYLKSGKYIWHTGKGYGTGKVTGANNKMTVTYMKNKPLKDLKTVLQTGDVVLVDDNKSGESGNGGHIFIVTGEWKGNSPYIWDNFTAAANPSPKTYGANRKVLAIVRMKNAGIGSVISAGVSSVDTAATAAVIAGNVALAVSPDKLYTSNNYEYTDVLENIRNDEQVNGGKNAIRDILKQWGEKGFTPIPDSAVDTKALVSGYLDNSRHVNTRVSGEVFGPSLPVALNPVESPFIEVTIGGYTFGTYDSSKYDKYPNYVDSLNVIRTNGSMNQYTISIIHQVRPGSNPNFIDELLSKNGYNKISIKYGDANSNVIFKDSNALLIGVDINFDFVSCNIKYTIKATSSAISIASHKKTFAGTKDKPSNVIRKLLYEDSSEDLLKAFPAMRDKNFVEQNNLIPTNDEVVDIDEIKNINVISYIKTLVSSMKSSTDSIISSNYMLLIEDEYFKISELSNSFVYDSLLYEVNINFPDENQIFSFNVDTNYAWPLAYDYSGGVSNYNYDILNSGRPKLFSTSSTMMLDFTSQMQENLVSNWWTQVTEFPVSAKLTCRGLLSPLLLLTYIKINCLYYGADRISSGVYIVTGQEDSLDSSGYKTTLSLLRVANSKQHLVVDGRVKT